MREEYFEKVTISGVEYTYRGDKPCILESKDKITVFSGKEKVLIEFKITDIKDSSRVYYLNGFKEWKELKIKENVINVFTVDAEFHIHYVDCKIHNRASICSEIDGLKEVR